MTRIATSLIAITVCAVAATQAQNPSAPVFADLTDTRTALGGDALASVQSFTVTGTLTRRLGAGPTIQSRIDIRSVLPNQFVVITTRVINQGPMGSFRITEHAGFNGDEPIDVVDAPDAPMPVRIPGFVPTTAEEIAAARAKLLRRLRGRFVQLTLPLFAQSFPSSPLEFLEQAGGAAGGGPEKVVLVRAPDGAAWELSLDAATHLPKLVRWQDRPIVVTSVTSTVTVGPGGRQMPTGPPPTLPSGDPTAGMPDVEWRMEIDDYKSKDGLTWPHRFRTFVDGRLYDDLRLRDYRINPKIDPKVFEPKGR